MLVIASERINSADFLIGKNGALCCSSAEVVALEFLLQNLDLQRVLFVVASYLVPHLFDICVYALPIPGRQSSEHYQRTSDLL